MKKTKKLKVVNLLTAGFDDVFEDIGDIKNVMFKGEMLFSETLGKPKDHYDVLENIASGTLGLVKKVRNKFSSCVRAMKVIKKAFIDLQEDEKNFMKEIAILRTLVTLCLPRTIQVYLKSMNSTKMINAFI